MLDFELQRQLVPYMKDLQPLPGIYDQNFIAANQEERANNLIKGSKMEQMETVRRQIREFKASSGVDKVVVLWTANTERYAEVSASCRLHPGRVIGCQMVVVGDDSFDKSAYLHAVCAAYAGTGVALFYQLGGSRSLPADSLLMSRLNSCTGDGGAQRHRGEPDEVHREERERGGAVAAVRGGLHPGGRALHQRRPPEHLCARPH